MKTKFMISVITSAAFVLQPCVSLAGRGDGSKAGTPQTNYNLTPTNTTTQSSTTPAATVPETPAAPQVGGIPVTGSTTGTTDVSTNSTLPNARTIQEVGKAAEKNSNKGVYLGMAGFAAASALAYFSCPNPKLATRCKLAIAGMVATAAVTGYMAGARKQSSGTVAAVTTQEPNVDPNLQGAGTTATPPVTASETKAVPDWENSPDWKNGMAVVEKLKADGWQIDPKKGTIVDPKGNKISPSIASSPAAMKAAGASDADIKAFMDAQDKAVKAVEAKLKGTDNGDMFGDSVGGGGSGTKSASADAYPGYPGAAAAGPQLGINRDPAQVAGMKKSFNGEPIGVAADSLFHMIDRRYQLHSEKGSFLPH